MKEDPPADFKCKDKFLVQGVRIDDSVMQMEDETLAKELAELWASAEAKKKADPRWASENFAERKLKVVFLPPSPSSLSATASPASKPPTVTVTEASDAPHLTAPTGMQGSKTSVTPLDADEEALQLGQARQTIARLQQRIQEMEKENSDLRDGGLRQRKVAQSAVASSGAPAAQKSSSGGVNLILVVLIAIIAFVLGAFFY